MVLRAVFGFDGRLSISDIIESALRRLKPHHHHPEPSSSREMVSMVSSVMVVAVYMILRHRLLMKHWQSLRNAQFLLTGVRI